jgi:hypothetical protein
MVARFLQLLDARYTLQMIRKMRIKVPNLRTSVFLGIGY